MSTELAIKRPSKKLYGITHNLDGSARVIEPKTLKVGIGLAKGPWIHVYIDLAKKWVVQVGKDDLKRLDSKAEAKKYYRTAKSSAPERKYPQRLPYFTFSHVSPDATFEPDFDAIESHGPLPTEIDIVFVRDDPFEASYQMWSATEKKCDGDGLNALRICSMASTPGDRKLAEAAQQRGEKYFPIINGCWMRACEFSKPQGQNKALCAPHGRLLFQLVNSPRLGGTSYFDTRGFRSVSQLFSCIETFKGVTGGGYPGRGFVAGIPLKMVLRPYKAVHEGKANTQYGVSLEFRAESALALKSSLIEHGVRFRESARVPIGELNQAPESGASIPPAFAAGTDQQLEVSAAALAAEFDGDEAAEAAADPVMPEVLSEVDGEEILDASGGALGQAWDPEPGDPGPVGDGAQVQSAPPAAARQSEQHQKLYQSARAKGITDSVLSRQLGLMGFESLEEVTDLAVPELTKWIQAYNVKK